MTVSLEQLARISNAGDNRYELTFDERTTLWSVNGGYIAAAAVRIAEMAGKFPRLASISCQFLRAFKPGPAEATVTVITSDTSAELLQIDLFQGGKRRALALVWTVQRKAGPFHRAMEMPVVPHPDELKRLEDIMQPEEPPIHTFWQPFEQRPINRIGSREKLSRTSRLFRWFRYVCAAEAPSEFMTAAGYLPIIDVMGVVSAAQLYDEPFLSTLAPTIQLAAHFYDVTDAGEWFLSDSFCEHTSDGLIPARVKIWSVKGQLLAHGFSQMVTRGGSGVYVAGKTQ